MSFFPEYIVDEIPVEQEEELEVPKEFGVDFMTGQLTGKVVEGTEAVKVWCYLALRTARYVFFICSWDYGNEMENLYGKGYSEEHIESEAKRMIKECLLVNPYIETVGVKGIKYRNGRLRAEITVNTVFGDSVGETYETEAAG